MWTASARPWISSHQRHFPQQKSAWSIAGKTLAKTKNQIDPCLHIIHNNNNYYFLLSFPIRDVHGLDLGVLAKRHAMDTFSFIRLVGLQVLPFLDRL